LLLPLLAAAWLVWAVGAFLFVRLVLQCVADLAEPPLTIVGQVVYLDVDTSGGSDGPVDYYVAVDDGTAGAITRYEVDSRTHSRLRPGAWVRNEVTRRLGAVLRADVLPNPAPRSIF
jgi:hypothetical protein